MLLVAHVMWLTCVLFEIRPPHRGYSKNSELQDLRLRASCSHNPPHEDPNSLGLGFRVSGLGFRVVFCSIPATCLKNMLDRGLDLYSAV